MHINIDEKEFNNYIRRACEAAKAGGGVLKKHLGKLTTIESKENFSDLVTIADRESESIIVDILEEHFPDHGILAEESHSGATRDTDFLWVIDPLDGTTNYAHSYPFFAVSIALLYIGKPILGVVFDPIADELFQAAYKRGAFLNNSPIQVSKTNTLNKSLLSTGFPYDRHTRKDNNYAEFCRLTHLTHGVRRDGAAALDLAYVAAGRFDGFWEQDLKLWDIAAGVVLVDEAGGQLSEYDESPLNLDKGRILATNGFIHTLVSKALMETPEPYIPPE